MAAKCRTPASRRLEWRAIFDHTAATGETSKEKCARAPSAHRGWVCAKGEAPRRRQRSGESTYLESSPLSEKMERGGGASRAIWLVQQPQGGRGVGLPAVVAQPSLLCGVATVMMKVESFLFQRELQL